jgi:hypothetical protein
VGIFIIKERAKEKGQKATIYYCKKRVAEYNQPLFKIYFVTI